MNTANVMSLMIYEFCPAVLPIVQSQAIMMYNNDVILYNHNITAKKCIYSYVFKEKKHKLEISFCTKNRLHEIL